MLKRTIFFIIMILYLVFFSANVSSAHTKSCAGCHADIGKGHKYIHPAVNLGCESCHMNKDGMQHPKQRGSILLRTDIPKLCFQCHKESKFTGKYVHLPIEKGMCLMCHDPHQSDIQELLRNEPQELCYRCHAKEKFTKKYVHKVAQGGCGIRCHSHHASDYPKLLESGISDMCIGCHKIQQSGNHIVSLPRGKVHPVFWEKDPGNRKKEMTCASCHNPHCSDYHKLFTYKRICNRCHKAY
jgi:predicted CXXCH cytochrome family protein